MKVAVFTDVHANAPALAAALRAIESEACDLVVCLGDVISVGPFPRETVELLCATPRLRAVMGNHDALFVAGLPEPAPAWMRPGVVAHHRWTHAQLDAELRAVMATWPAAMTFDLEGTWASFVHYALADTDRRLAPVVPEPDAHALDELFASSPRSPNEVLFFGHDHASVDVRGRRRYVNPGSLGCCDQARARFVIASFAGAEVRVERRWVEYDDAPLREAFARRRVPDRANLDRIFFGSRLGLRQDSP